MKEKIQFSTKFVNFMTPKVEVNLGRDQNSHIVYRVGVLNAGFNHICHIVFMYIMFYFSFYFRMKLNLIHI